MLKVDANVCYRRGLASSVCLHFEVADVLLQHYWALAYPLFWINSQMRFELLKVFYGRLNVGQLSSVKEMTLCVFNSITTSH